MTSRLNAFLAAAEPEYDPQLKLLGSTLKGVGYHTRLPDGMRVHSTRDAMNYAAALLAEGSHANVERGREVLAKVLSLQERDSYKPTFGIWSWFYEEPLDKMAPPDWNWADFLGATLCHILRESANRLTPELRAAAEQALENAAWSIFRRNMQPHYTNIAIMGAAVTAVAGEIRGIPLLVTYARSRIKTFMEYARDAGGLNEYNSPNYTFVALEEAERMLQLSTDPEVRFHAEELRVFIWESLAAFYHPATGQFAPPHSRSYSDTLSGTSADVLRNATGLPLLGPPGNPLHYSQVRPLPCPKALIPRFAALPEKEQFIERRFIRREPDSASTRGRAWLTHDVAFGSVSFDSLWMQRRPLGGFWVNPADPGTPYVFNTDAWKDNREFASLGLRSIQAGNRTLSLAVAYTDRGDYHLMLDRPKDGVYRFCELAIGWELTGPGVEIRQIAPRSWSLRGGGYQLIVHVGSGTFLGREVALEPCVLDGSVMLKAILYRGGETAVAFDEKLEFALPFALEVLPAKAKAHEVPLSMSLCDGVAEVRGNGLALSGSIFATRCE